MDAEDGDAQLCQLLVQDIWDGSRLWCSLLMLHRGCTFFGGIQVILLARCQLLPLHFGRGLAGQDPLFPGPSLAQTWVPLIHSLALVLWQLITDSRPGSALECLLTNWTPSSKSQQSLHAGKVAAFHVCSLIALCVPCLPPNPAVDGSTLEEVCWGCSPGARGRLPTCR